MRQESLHLRRNMKPLVTTLSKHKIKVSPFEIVISVLVFYELTGLGPYEMALQQEINAVDLSRNWLLIQNSTLQHLISLHVPS